MKSAKNNSLLRFMASNINSKSIAQNSNKAANLAIKKKNKFGEIIDEEEEEEKKKKAIELRNAKNESNYKASQMSKFEMYKKLIINAIIGYLAIMISAFLLVIAVIELGPSLINFFNFLLYKIVIASFAA